MSIARSLATIALACALPFTAFAIELRGDAVQGGIMFGKADPGSEVSLDGREIMVSPDGHFVIGFGRDETGVRKLEIAAPGTAKETVELAVAQRDYDIERVDGLPPRTVTPDPEAAERIRNDIALVTGARKLRDQRTDYIQGFTWPARGRISGDYGSQRILNGEPRRPHYGLDIAAPTGSPVMAPADGVITLAHPDMYYSGGTIILDHGQGLSSSFLHLSKVLVEVGDEVQQGDVIAEIGATGRASGPHLDWRMNWLDKRVNPHELVEGAPPKLEESAE